MKIDLQQILPKTMSDEAALQLVNFVHNLSVALESIYFDQMLHYTSRDQNNHCIFNKEEDNSTL